MDDNDRSPLHWYSATATHYHTATLPHTATAIQPLTHCHCHTHTHIRYVHCFCFICLLICRAAFYGHPEVAGVRATHSFFVFFGVFDTATANVESVDCGLCKARVWHFSTTQNDRADLTHLLHPLPFNPVAYLCHCHTIYATATTATATLPLCHCNHHCAHTTARTTAVRPLKMTALF
jgi:hypothetical protein